MNTQRCSTAKFYLLWSEHEHTQLGVIHALVNPYVRTVERGVIQPSSSKTIVNGIFNEIFNIYYKEIHVEVTCVECNHRHLAMSKNCPDENNMKFSFSHFFPKKNINPKTL